MFPVNVLHFVYFLIFLQDGLVDSLGGLWNCSPLRTSCLFIICYEPSLKAMGIPFGYRVLSSASTLPTGGVLLSITLRSTWAPIIQGLRCFDPSECTTLCGLKTESGSDSDVNNTQRLQFIERVVCAGL